MKIDCQWLNANQEAYCCDTLDAEHLRLAREHVQSCAACAREIEALQELDALVRSAFRRRLHIAQASSRSPARPQFRWALAAAAAGLAALLLFTVFSSMDHTGGFTVTNDAPAQEAGALQEAAATGKEGDSPEDARGKPEDAIDETGASGGILNSTFGTAILPDGVDFAVIDAAGYAMTLEDYRGYILLAAIWDGTDPHAAGNIELLYRTFAADSRLRVIGVSHPGTTRISGTTFPEAFNHGSRLFGAGDGEFLLVDGTGEVRLHGSLLGDANELVADVRNELETLGIR